jgi:hypothetical protein
MLVIDGESHLRKRYARLRVGIDLSSNRWWPVRATDGTRVAKAHASDRSQLRIDQSELGADHLRMPRQDAAFRKSGHG